MIKVLQINLAGKSVAQDMALQRAREEKIDLIIASEYYKYGHYTNEANGWYCDKDSRAAIVNCHDAQIEEIGKPESGFTWITIRKTRIYSCYISPNITLTEYENWLARLEISIRTATCDVIVAGDFNAKHYAWGSQVNDNKGESLSEFVYSLGLVVCNRGNRPTRQGGDSESHIDVTMVSAHLATRITNWKVSDDFSHSDHNYIEYNIEDLDIRPRKKLMSRNLKSLDRDKLCKVIIEKTSNINTGITAKESADALNRTLIEILDEVAPRKEIITRRKSVYWWTPHIKQLRETSNRLRRVYTRKRKRVGGDACEPEREALRLAKLELTKSIKKAKEDAWRELCTMVESDPWGKPYKLVMGKLCKKTSIPGIDIPGRIESIIEGLFPTHQYKDTRTWKIEENPTYITDTELKQAAKSLKANKAPGIDGVPNEILKEVAKLRPGLMLDTYNKCITQGSFPREWKAARLVLVRKGDKPLDNPSSYRPLCMLNTAGKLFEKILDSRIRDFLEKDDRLAPNQYGFRRGRSTVDAATRLREIVDGCGGNVRNMVGLLTLDVRNAFNSAPWIGIIEAVAEKKLPTYICKILDDYFHDRTLTYETAGREETRRLSAGVPQGSVLGPTMWNVLYDGLLREQMPEGVKLIAYADDVAITAMAKNKAQVERLLEDAAEKVIKWLEETGIELAIQKSETILFTKKRKQNQLNIMIRGHLIQSKDSVKYLGLHLNSKLNFKEHARITAMRADDVTTKLTRIMPNTGGAKTSRRKLLATVSQSIMLYGAPVWAKHMGRNGWSVLDRSNRKIGLRVIAAYRTVSKPAVEVISGMAPPELIAEYRRSVKMTEDRAIAGNKMTQAWQSRWDQTVSGRWTHRLIPDIKRWNERHHGMMVDFHLTQALTGHGCFSSYLHRFGKLASPACKFCDDGYDDAEHTLFTCDAFHTQRLKVETTVGIELTPENMVETMMGSKRNWEDIKSFITEILKRKEEEERERQRQQ